MNNSTNYLGNSVFGQLISLIPKYQVQKAVKEYQSDKFTKRFSTWEHLISMLFATASNTTSLRDVTNGLLGLEGKLQHLSLSKPPKRSTISDANKRRSYQVFEKIYYKFRTYHTTFIRCIKKFSLKSCIQKTEFIISSILYVPLIVIYFFS